jgi:hypothetical protein
MYLCSKERHGDMKKNDFLGHYFVNVYNKLETDALLFNRKLPHAGLVGSENELALSLLLRDFLPPQFGIESNGIVIDQFGNASKQCDIIIYDAKSFPKYFRKIFPIEVVYGVIEVKTCITTSEAKNALENLKSVNELEFHPALTPYWKTKSKEQNLVSNPPFGLIFAYRSVVKNFETFAKWFPWEWLFEGKKLIEESQRYPEIRTLTVVALDQGIIKMESSNGHIQRWIPTAEEEAISRSFETKYKGLKVLVDPAKTLFIALETIWKHLGQHHIHPGFDIRSYMSSSMDEIIPVDNDCD